MKRHKATKCSVCSHDFSVQIVTDELICPNCHTRYDLVHKKTDRSQTMINPASCNHRRTQLVEGSRWTSAETSGRYDVRICLDCCEIIVAGTWDGKYIKVSFTLMTDEALAAVGKFRRMVDADDEP